MHLVFEPSQGKFKSNCNILALAWMPYYNESKFRQALFDYHRKQLINLTSANNAARSQSGGGTSSTLQNGQLRNNSRTNEGQPASSSSSQASGDNISAASNHISFQRSKFLNSRVAELYQRFAYSKDSCLRPLINDNNTAGNDCCSKVSLARELDKKYGRMPDFGWLVVGNINRIVGVVLTSTVELPPKSQSAVKNSVATSSSSASNANSDLMQFIESSNVENQANNNQENPSLEANEFELTRPDRGCVRSNYNLRGHLDEIILVKWNELYQKLATVDSKGNVLIWCIINDKFTIQTPFYNRTKSVADFKWSNDGKTALICYTDSFILAGSSSGQRNWHSMLNLEEYRINCASWAPNDKQLLLGLLTGNVVVIDLPRGELTELAIDRTNIRTMCWSSSELSLGTLDQLSPSNSSQAFKQQQDSKRQQWNPRISSAGANAAVVNHRVLSRDGSVFLHYRLCSQTPNISSNNNNNANQRSQSSMGSPLAGEESRVGWMNNQEADCDRRKNENENNISNILAIDLANNTIKLFAGGLADPEPLIIRVNLESYIMHWSGDGKILAVAGFNIHTSAPSIGCLKCRYLNSIKFYNQFGRLIYEHTLRYTRYPITAFTWAHEDQRLFVATGPRLHCAKVFLGIPTLSTLAASCIRKRTRLAQKADILEGLYKNHYSLNVSNWQSYNCPLDVHNEFKRAAQLMRNQSNARESASKSSQLNAPKQMMDYHCSSMASVCQNNANVFQYGLPQKLQLEIDQLFAQTVKPPYNEHWSLNDIIWHVPNNEQRHYCTLICYTSEHEIGSTNYHRKNNEMFDLATGNHASEQYKIFVLYVEFQGSLIPILRARRIGFLKPEFVIFDPEDQQFRVQRQRKVSDVSQQSSLNSFIQRRLNCPYPGAVNQLDLSASSQQFIPSASSPLYFSENASSLGENCSDLHLCPDQTASNSSLGRQSFGSDLEHYYNFECDTVNRQHQARMADLVSSRSHHQEPLALPISNPNPYLLYMMTMNAAANGGCKSAHSGKPDRSVSAKQKVDRLTRLKNSTSTSDSLTETRELLRIKSNIWGTKFKLVNLGNQMIKQKSVLGSVVYKASLLHLQPRQIFLAIKDMSNYCSLCSKHHHSRPPGRQFNGPISGSDQLKRASEELDKSKISILDLPNVAGPSLATPSRGDRRSSQRSSSSRAGEEKIILSVGDNIRVAPKLDQNQQYKLAQKFKPSNERASTSKSACKTTGLAGNNWKDKSLSFLSNQLLLSHNLRDLGGESQSKNSKFCLKPALARQDHLRNPYQSSSETHHSKLSNHFERHPNRPLNKSICSTANISSSSSNSEPFEQSDDILTLSLGQGDQVKVEMSSLRNLQGGEQLEQANNNKHCSGENLNNFLATNKTLKSIQTITQMIVDLSSKANNIDDNDGGEASNQDHLSSPSKMVKLSDNGSHPNLANSPRASRFYEPPETPVHRPRRIAAGRYSLSGANTSPISASQCTQSANASPLHDLLAAPRRRRGRATEKLAPRHKMAPNIPLPPPPPSAPIGRRLSSSAKRFIDGSLRSLYGGNGNYSSSDMEPEENEPLVSGRHSSTGYNLPKGVRHRLMGQSQPCSPMKGSSEHFSGAKMKQSSESGSIRTQLIQRLRGKSDSSSGLGQSAAAGSKSCTTSFSNLKSEVRSAKFNGPRRTDRSSSELTFSSSSSGSDFESSSSEFSSDEGDNELEVENFYRSLTNNQSQLLNAEGKNRNRPKRKQRNENGNGLLSTSVQDLREFDQLKRELKVVSAKVQQRSKPDKRRSGRQRKLRRKKSICPDSRCCCAREFKLSNRPPVWNELSQVYQLDFGGRVTQESAKNLQIDFKGNLALQFGRIDRCTYTLDYKYPFNAVQAMAIALASLTQRLK